MLDITDASINKLKQIEGNLAAADQVVTDDADNLDAKADLDLYKKQLELQKKKMGVGKLAGYAVQWDGAYQDYHQSASSVIDVDFNSLPATDLMTKLQAFRDEVTRHSASSSSDIITELQDTESEVEVKKLELTSTLTSIAQEEN